MEKLVYVVWKRDDVSAEAFRDDWVGPRGAALADCGARRIALDVVDSDVAYARGSVLSTFDTPMTGVLSFWLDTHLERARAEALIRESCARAFGYLVLESVPIVNATHAAPPGARTPGTITVGFLRKPEHLTYDAWLELWQGQHTRVAIETQSTFLYVQNAVVRALTPEAPPWVAIVEEGFPREALSDPMVFYAAGGSEATLNANRLRMIESCRRFIEFEALDSHVFSQYRVSD